MKSSIMVVLVVAFAVSFALTARAQEGGAPREHSMTGCLAKGDAPGTFKVTNVEKNAQGRGPDSIGIVSSTANLAPHVGHKIEVTGTAVPPKEAEADTNIPKAPHYMKLTGIKMISPTCP